MGTYKVKTDEAEPTVGYINRDLVRKVEEPPQQTSPVRNAPETSDKDGSSWLARNWGWSAAGAALSTSVSDSIPFPA